MDKYSTFAANPPASCLIRRVRKNAPLTQRRIRRQQNPLLITERLQLVLRKAGVHLDLVDGGDDGAVREERAEVLDGEVGDADGFYFT